MRPPNTAGATIARLFITLAILFIILPLVGFNEQQILAILLVALMLDLILHAGVYIYNRLRSQR